MADARRADGSVDPDCRSSAWCDCRAGREMEGCDRRDGTLGGRKRTGNGRVQLVVDRLAEIQERGHRAVGSGKANNSRNLGLAMYIWQHFTLKTVPQDQTCFPAYIQYLSSNCNKVQNVHQLQ